MRQVKVLSSLAALLLLMAYAWVSAGQAPARPDAMLFEGARLIAGDGRPPIDNAAFLVENNKFSKVGRKGEVRGPAGATRVDLTGKTVIPALVDPHNHIGYTNHKT